MFTPTFTPSSSNMIYVGNVFPCAITFSILLSSITWFAISSGVILLLSPKFSVCNPPIATLTISSAVACVVSSFASVVFVKTPVITS